ncbi:MAG: 30S ribosomal protein S8 [Magnetococcales bacterium]|nr:30S ribosomal protein S8 [Magnetococcales bacterium]
MGMTDPISDMLTRIRNAQAVRKDRIDVPASKMKERIARILMEEGYLASVETITPATGWPMIRLGLKYYKNRPAIEKIRRISRPGQRRYHGRNAIPKINQGLGMTILSTSKGVLSSRQARKLGVGGELLCLVF